MRSATIAVGVIILMTTLFGAIAATAQGTLIYLNGKERRFTRMELKDDYILYKPEGSTSDWMSRADRFNIFSILRDDGSEEILYQPDSTDQSDPTIAEVRDYIAGQKYAANRYRKPLNMIGGIASGLAGSVGGFYGIPVPLVYATIVGQINPKPPKGEAGQVFSESFNHGYQRKARNMKIKNSLIGGGIGFGVGIAALMIFYAND